MIAIIDYGVGNLFSLCASLAHLKLDSVVTRDKKEIEKADKIILPGVGAFGDAADKLRETGLFTFLQEQARGGKPFLGICLGMQLLFEKGYEYGVHDGLALIGGDIRPLADDIKGHKIPQMGWNALHFHLKDDPFLQYVSEGAHVYFVHSYYAKDCEKSVVASAEYGVMVPGVVKNKNVYGTQFHPEKSGEAGLLMLRAFSQM